MEILQIVRDNLPLYPVTLRGIKPALTKMPMNTIGEHIRKRRVELQLSQKEVSKIIGVTENTVHFWETGRYKPLKKYYSKIDDFINCDA